MSVFAEHFTLTYLCCFSPCGEMQVIPLGVADFRGNPLLTLAGRHRRTVFPSFWLCPAGRRTRQKFTAPSARLTTHKIHGAGRT